MSFNIKDIARIAEVSTATVSHVINGTRFVSDETKKKVMDTMKKLDYHPNLVARSLRSQKSKTIGLLVPNISDYYFTAVAEGIEHVLRKNGYHMLLSNTHERTEEEKEMINVFRSQFIDGLIIAPAVGDHSYLHQLIDGSFPLVFIDRKPKGFEGDCVVLDNIISTSSGVGILLEKGHRRIGLELGYETISTTEDRIKGYKMAFSKYNMDVDNALIKAGDFTYDSGYSMTKELVEKEKVTALFIASGTMAIGALLYLQENKIKIPEDIAIISCNDFKYTQISNPPLTVISQPSNELGENAAELLLSNIKHSGKKKKFKEIRLPTSIVLREST